MTSATQARALVAVFFLAATITIVLLLARAPAAEPPNAAPEEFSAVRAFAHIQEIARAPHPLGSPENMRVCDYLLTQLRSLDLKPEVQQTPVVASRWGAPYRTARVRNVIARMRGAANSRALMLAAHYDSVPSGPGASDDGSGVATLLETARALRAGRPLKNDVIFLFTDGEEWGMLGAEAFVKQHRWAKDVGLVLNFDVRGTGGPSALVETSAQSGALLDLFRRAAPYPFASSLAPAVSKSMPNDTDFTIFERAGMAGLNFGYVGHVERYHTRTDSSENLDLRSLQHDGSYALSLSHQFGNRVLPLKARLDPIYFSIGAHQLVCYPQSWARLLALGAMALFAIALVLGTARNRFSLVDVARGAAFYLIAIVGVPAIVTLIVLAISGAMTPGMRYALNYVAHPMELGFVLTAVAAAAALCAWRRLPIYGLWMGAMVWWLILVCLSAEYLPGGSYFVWPVLFSLIGAGGALLTAKGDERSWLRLWIVSLFSVPAIAMLAPTISALFDAATLVGAGVAALLAVLSLGLIVPLLDAIVAAHRRLVPAACAIVATLLIVVPALAVHPTARDPVPDSLFYFLDVDGGNAVWATEDRTRDPYTSQFLSAHAVRGALPGLAGVLRTRFLIAPAPVADVRPAGAVKTQDALGTSRRLRIHLSSPDHAPVITVLADPSAEMISSAVDGHEIDPGAISELKPVQRRMLALGEGSRRWGVAYFGVPDAGFDIDLATKSARPLRLLTLESFDGLPTLAIFSYQRRPFYLMPTPFLGLSVLGRLCDSTLVLKTYTF